MIGLSRRQQRQPNDNTTTYCVYWRTTTTINPIIIDWVYCCCRSSVNIICGRIMIGLSLLSSVSKHNMWSCYDRQQRQPNENTTTYCVYWRTTTTINPIIIRPHCMFTDRRQQRQPNHNTTTYYYWVYCCCRPSVNILCGRIMIGLSLLSSVNHNTTTYCVYWRNTTTTQS
jgi:hypothetical protein